MINQRESKQVGMDFWLLKLLSQDMKTKAKNKDQPTNNHEKWQKSKSNVKYNIDHHPKNGQTGDTDP